jgi:shikimate kinase
MGAGKTSVGQALAARLGWRFVDLDDHIVANTGRQIAELFREAGEAAFRQAETQALAGLLSVLRCAPGAVVALGGGAFVQSENARMLEEFGAPVVFLDAPVEELRRRCSRAGHTRPLYADENHFRQLYESRRRAYMEASVRVDTAEKSIPQVAAEVAQRLGLGESYDTAQK